MTTETKPHNRLALVIGSGSVKCAAGLGLYRALEREGLRPDLLVGSSGGGIVVTNIALGHSASDIEALMLRLWTHDTVANIDPRAILRILLPGRFKFDEHFGLINDRQLMKSLRDTLGELQFADTKVPLYLVATDVWTGDRVVINQGSLVDGLRASIASPLVFRPWQVGEHLLYDGAMSDPLPVDVAIREGAGTIITMGFESPYHEKMPSLISIILQMTSVMNNNLLRSSFAFNNLAHHAEIIPIIPQFEKRIGFADTHLIPYIIEEGERAAEPHIAYLKRLLANQ